MGGREKRVGNEIINFTLNRIHLHNTECVKFRNPTNRGDIVVCVWAGIFPLVLPHSLRRLSEKLWAAAESEPKASTDDRTNHYPQTISGFSENLLSCSFGFEEGKERHKRISPSRKSILIKSCFLESVRKMATWRVFLRGTREWGLKWKGKRWKDFNSCDLHILEWEFVTYWFVVGKKDLFKCTIG